MLQPVAGLVEQCCHVVECHERRGDFAVRIDDGRALIAAEDRHRQPDRPPLLLRRESARSANGAVHPRAALLLGGARVGVEVEVARELVAAAHLRCERPRILI